MRRLEGQLTVFFALAVTMIFALMLSLLESARTQGTRVYAVQAVNSAMDSLFSQYHRTLWEDYRILGLEHYADEQLYEEMRRFAAPYFEKPGWFPVRIESFEAAEKELLTDRDGEFFEKEVLDYMRYGIAETLWDQLKAESVQKDLSEAAALDRVSDLYEAHAEEALLLEKAIEEIGLLLKEQAEQYETARSAAEALSGGSLIRSLEKMKACLRRLPERVQDYEEKADRLAEALTETRLRYEAERPELSAAVQEEMEKTIGEYAAYVEEDGARRQEIRSLLPRAETNILFLDGVIEEAEAVMEYIASWEPADEEDELDEEALWVPVQRRLSEYDLLQLVSAGGVADKEKEGFLKAAASLIKGNILAFLLPPDAEIAKEALLLSEPPSKTCFSGINGCRLTLLERVLMGEYMLKSLNFYGCGEFPGTKKERGSGHLEVEYVLNGKASDYENLSDTVFQLLALREGMNLIYLFSDAEKRAEARNLAALITGAAGFTPLILVTTFFILGVWALGQALCDLRDLLAGKTVRLLHNRSSFYLSLEGLLSLGQSGKLSENEREEAGGLSYQEYLRMLLFYGQSALYTYRTMDMIQMNIRRGQQDFLLKRCVYSLKLKAEAETGHMLAGLGILGRVFPLPDRHQIRFETFYSY